MTETILLWMMPFCGLCALTAFRKDRNVLGWAVAGAIFNIPAVLTLLCLPRFDQQDQRLSSTINLRLNRSD